MLLNKRTRVYIIMAWGFLLGLLFFVYNSKFHESKQIFRFDRETTRLDPEKNVNGAIAGGGAGGTGSSGSSGNTKDLTNDPGQPFNPEKEYKAILSEAPGK